MRKKAVMLKLLLLSLLGFWLLQPVRAYASNGEGTNIYGLYLNTTQKSDSSLIESDGEYLLIDIGRASSVPAIITQLETLDVTDVNIMFSHLHIDHIGGDNDDWLRGLRLLENSGIQIDRLYLPDPSLTPQSIEYSSKYRKIEEYISSTDTEIVYLKVGDTIQVGTATGQVIGPIASENITPFRYSGTSKERYTRYENNCSLATMFDCDGVRYLCVGDAYGDEAQALVDQYGSNLSCDILKLNHHGTGNGNSKAFFKATRPVYSYAPNTGLDDKVASGKWRTASAVSRASKYGMVYLVGQEKQTIIYHIEDGQIFLYRGSEVKEKNKMTGWQWLYGADGIVRDHDMYYLDDDCLPLTGFQEIDDKYYNFKSGGRMDYGAQDASGAYVGWTPVGNDGKLRYYDVTEDKMYADILVGTHYVDGKPYYFDEEGYLLTAADSTSEFTVTQVGSHIMVLKQDHTLLVNDWYTIGENKHYFDEKGEMVRNGMKEIEESFYLFDENGDLLTAEPDCVDDYDLIDYQDKTYAINMDGELVISDWSDYDGDTYYFDKDGVMVYDQFLEIDGERYYVDEIGVLTRGGKFEVEDKLYYARNDGSLVCGKKFTREGKSYYARTTGEILRNVVFTYKGVTYKSNGAGVLTKVVTKTTGKKATTKKK